MKYFIISLYLLLINCVSAGNAEYSNITSVERQNLKCYLPFQTYEIKLLSGNSDPDSSGSGRYRFQDPFNEIQIKAFVDTTLSSYNKKDSNNSFATIEYTELTNTSNPYFIFYDITLGIFPYMKERTSIVKLSIRNKNNKLFQEEIQANWTVYMWALGSLLGFPLSGKNVEDRQKEIIESSLLALIGKSNEKLNPVCRN